tara:strand:- start:6348 stop:7994 length:1647 start_codon:yes stop_codon:yes gene_type:complete
MPTNWRVYDSSTVLSALDKTEFPGFFGNIVVGPNEAAVIIRNGKIEQTITASSQNTSGIWDNFKRLWGGKPDLEVIFVDTSPLDFSFYIGSSDRREDGIQTGHLSESRDDAYRTLEDRSRNRIDTTTLTITALTSDGQNVSAEVNVTLKIEVDDAALLTGLLRGKRALADWDIAALVRDELLAKSFVPLIGRHSGSDIRGNQNLMNEIVQSAESTMRHTFDLYGLNLINMYVNWGLTAEDKLMIAEGQKDREDRALEFDHTRTLREQQRELELEHQRISNLQQLESLEAAGEVELQEIILAGEINRDQMRDGKRVSETAINAQVREIELDIERKASLLAIDTKKAEADAQFAIQERQGRFDQEMKALEEEREMQRLTDLNRLQLERQSSKAQSDLDIAKQQAEATQEALRARLDASATRTEEEQRTLRELMGAAGSADPAVLQEMLRQGTDREYVEGSDSKMASRADAQRPSSPSPVSDTTNNTPPPNAAPSPASQGAACSTCHTPLQPGWKLCPSCGTTVAQLCRNCSEELQASWVSCPHCGFPTKT